MAQESTFWTKIKKSRGQVLVTPDRANPTHSDTTEGGQAVSKPMASLYATRGGLAVTLLGSSVAISTVLMVAR